MLSVAADCYDAKQDTEISVDSGSVYGLLHDDTKPLPILIYNQRFSRHSPESNFTRSAQELDL